MQFEQAEPPIGLNDLAYAIKHADDDFDFENYIRAESAFYSGLNQFYKFASVTKASAGMLLLIDA